VVCFSSRHAPLSAFLWNLCFWFFGSIRKAEDADLDSTLDGTAEGTSVGSPLAWAA
jgi:hypothetical protein